jgi:putative SOS response-associated peptidase YedK
MCYSAQIRADFRRYTRAHGATMDIAEYVRLFWQRGQDRSIKIPRAMSAAFYDGTTEQEKQIEQLIATFNEEEANRLQAELFAQRKRLNDAERSLQTKTTKKAQEDQRIATSKIDAAMRRLTKISATEFTDIDSRIFPQWYAHVMIHREGKRVVLPMRYGCRLEGKPAFYDTKYPGTYNARRDNLEGFWKKQFGVHHGVLLITAFYENVPRHKSESRELSAGEAEENVVLEFRPNSHDEMALACLWSPWTGNAGEDTLLSFAAITDEPPPEVAAAGHDRCVIPLKPGNIDRWLSPSSTSEAQALLEDRERPFYAHVAKKLVA